ncbi:MAG TPA: aminomethyltransferase family protein [Pyrinomonadaceae bacterium]|jgi:folate-binding protein YgfZ|nr:aminomethyltransferase family protein [Pyrinomonadaceae bacterium]
MSEVIEQIPACKTGALDAAHRAGGATMSEREGWSVPAHYGDAAAEYDAVRGGAGAGAFDLSARGRVEVSGAEAVQFLNGLITNDVKTLAEGAWMNAAFPNVQGRLVAHARVLRLGDRFLFDTEAATHERVRQTLARFTLAGDFRVADRTVELTTLSVQGARAPEIIAATLGAEAASVERGRIYATNRRGANISLIRATHTAEDGFDLFIEATQANVLWESLLEAGARPCGFEALEVLRVEAGVPRYGIDINDTNVVLEAALDDAVSFTKGCYIGQEIIARIHWRGHVAKRLAALRFEDARDIVAAAAPRDAKILAPDGREIGRVTSSVFSPRLGCAVALGIVKYDYLKPETEVRVRAGEDERAARVAEVPLVRGSWFAAHASSDGSAETL